MAVEPLLQDLGFAVRMLRRNPFLSLTVVITLGLGIGFTSTTFNIANGFIHKDLPFEAANRIVAVDLVPPAPGADPAGFTTRDLVRWRDRQSSLQQLAAYGSGQANLSTRDGRAERLSGGYFTAGVFETLAVRPMLGRTFEPDDERPGADPVLLISHALWQSWFDGSAQVVGRIVEVNRQPRTIVGVMPPEASFPFPQDFWIPIVVDAAADLRDEGDAATRWSAIGRLRDGISLGEARANLTTVATQLAAQYPGEYQGVGVTVTTLKRRLVPLAYYPLFYTLVAATFGVLLIGCANVTTLLLARGSARTLEFAMRTALGAPRRRLIRQLMAEVSVLALLGGGLGLALGLFGLRQFAATLQSVIAASGEASEVPVWMAFGPDIRVFLFVAGATAFATAFAGVFPAYRLSAAGPAQLIKSEARGVSGLRAGRVTGGLVIAEVAASCLLLVLAGLMIRSLVHLTTVDLPFATDRVFTARLVLPSEEYPSAETRRQFFDRLLVELQAVPGVSAVTLATGVPGTGFGTTEFFVEGQDDSVGPRTIRYGRVTPGFFEVFDVGAIEGRLLAGSDRDDTLPVAVVNETLARTALAGDAIGRRIRFGDDDPWRTVVGVVPDLAMEGFGSGQDPAGIFVPFAQAPTGSYVSMALATRGPPMAVADDVRAAVASLDRYLPIYRVMGMDGVMLRVTWFYPYFGRLLVTLGLVALFLGAIGLYGVMSFAVTQRTREMGIRLAMGARAQRLVGLAMRKAVVQLGVGVTIGLLLAMPTASRLTLFLYDVDARDPLVFGAVLVTLVGTGLVASFLPARRVTRLDPMAALTAE